MALASAIFPSLVLAGLASADTGSFVPLPDEPVRDSASSLVVPALLLILAIGALALVSRRPRSRRPIGAVLAVLLLVFGVLTLLAGLFGDLSGQHRVFIVPVGIGLAAIVVSVVGFWRLRRAPSGPQAEPARGASDH